MINNYKYNDSEEDAIEKNYNNNLYEMVIDMTNEQDWPWAIHRLKEIYDRPFKMIGKYSWDEIVDAVDPDACILLYGIDKEDVIEELEEECERYYEEEYERKLLADFYYGRDNRL